MAEFGVDEAALQAKRLSNVNAKKFARGFDLLNSFTINWENNLDVLRREGTPEEVMLAKERIEQAKLMRSALEKGDAKPLIEHIIDVINNNMRFIKTYTIAQLLEEKPNRFDIIKDLLETLEQLKHGE